LGRLLPAIALCAVALFQSTVALAAPSPSPSLDGLLLAPPGTGFVEADKNTPGIFEGPFDAAGYADITAAKPSNTQTTQALNRDGFLAGYGRTWVSQARNHIFVEAVMAFGGGSGAKTWLGQSQTADKAEPTYQRPLTTSGIGTYYGARLVDSANSIYAEAYAFVKGNNTYLISAVSTSDDLGTSAAVQAKRQYDSAPSYTVPPSQWPESKTSNVMSNAVKVAGTTVAGILILALVVGTYLIAQSRRRPVHRNAPVQMSEDRHSWWDGTTWRDAEHQMPPAAPRSDDGRFWWDGITWRPIPDAAPK
jgi:hypothetical protein